MEKIQKRRVNDRVRVPLTDGGNMTVTIIKVLSHGTYIAQHGNDTGFITEANIIDE